MNCIIAEPIETCTKSCHPYVHQIVDDKCYCWADENKLEHRELNDE